MNESTIKKATADLKNSLIKRYGAGIELILFGSVATGNYTKESDVDILVILPFEVDNFLEEEIFGMAYDIEFSYNIVFGIIAYSRDFWISPLANAMPLYQNIQKHGIPL